jgi:hypothetical protein
MSSAVEPDAEETGVSNETARGEPSDATQLLLAFVRDRDVSCPRCAYNLRNLTRPICPECGETFTLRVGAERPVFGLLLLTMAPGIFSGIAAVIFGLEMLVYPKAHPPEMWFVYLFGALSGIFAGLLFAWRWRFMKQKQRRQTYWAVGVWAIHIAVFVTVAMLY